MSERPIYVIGSNRRGWYVCHEDGNVRGCDEYDADLYLHSDGEWRIDCSPFETGYFKSQEEAVAAFEKAVPGGDWREWD